jgi:hypothetical protein
MIFNGHTHDTLAQLDEMTMLQIQTMYSDGLIGNQGMMTVLGQLTAGVFNYMRPANAPDYKLSRILGQAYDYIVPPLTPEQQKEASNNALKTYMMMAPGFSQDRFKS